MAAMIPRMGCWSIDRPNTRSDSHACSLSNLYYSYLVDSLLFLPNLLLPPLPPPPPPRPLALPLPPLPFILAAEYPLISPVLSASPLLLNLFFPPKPNLASFFCRLKFPSPVPRSRPEDDLAALSSTAMDSKMSALGSSWVASEGLDLRSVTCGVSSSVYFLRGGGWM